MTKIPLYLKNNKKLPFSFFPLVFPDLHLHLFLHTCISRSSFTITTTRSQLLHLQIVTVNVIKPRAQITFTSPVQITFNLRLQTPRHRSSSTPPPLRRSPTFINTGRRLPPPSSHPEPETLYHNRTFSNLNPTPIDSDLRLQPSHTTHLLRTLPNHNCHPVTGSEPLPVDVSHRHRHCFHCLRS
ncbi:hypothetical protein HanIR_Chr14g0701401 [Helianthus annuus]|nr:hypothetical protein HanIR_Chr14g0701401 [Helianthus annuus]